MTLHQSPGGEQIESGDIVQRFREHEADDCAEWARDEVALAAELRPLKWAAAAFLALLLLGLALA